jgi:hypothetical protein
MEALAPRLLLAERAVTLSFLMGAHRVSWSTVTDFKFGQDKATIWDWRQGVSKVSWLDEQGGANGYQGLTLHFENLLPDDAAAGQTNSNFNSITLSRLTLADFGASSLADLNAQIIAGTNSHFIGVKKLIKPSWILAKNLVSQ